ncbi:MAG: hypothetical protein KR126chlam3_00635 [Chlamydiae bacterium]|nr:hypothetical protein [Chlamydiota bacterium]
MLLSLFFLTGQIVPIDGEFEEWDEFEVIEDSYENFIGESLIGSTEWTDYLQELDPHLDAEPIESDLHILFQRYIKKGSVAVDYGAGCGGRALAFAPLVGTDGRVIALECEPELFRGLFWNLVRGKVQNAKIYCCIEDDRIDSLELENVSMLRIDAKGREDCILKGAVKTIRKYKPVLMINLLGGIVIEQSDRFIKQEFECRMGEIQKMGYRLQRIQDSWYLALPLE